MNWFRKPTLIKALHELENTGSLPSDIQNETLSSDVLTNGQIIREIFHDCSDVVFRSIAVGGQPKILLVYVDGLVDTKVLDETVLKPWMFNGMPQGLGKLRSIGQVLEQQLVAIAETKTITTIGELVSAIVKANVVILADGENKALVASVKGFEKRAIDEPKTESSIRGPRESFTENLRTNTVLIRRRIANPKLKMESFIIGEVTQTDVVLVYVEGIAVHSVVEVVRKRLHDIRFKGIIDSGYITEFMEDAPLSPFPQIQESERPDIVAASLLEGKVAILSDGSPFVLIIPVTIWSGLQAPDDHYERFVFVVTRRMLRYIMTLVSLTLPAIYVALTTYNPDMLPASLYQSIATARERSPFPTVIEVALAEFVFEGLQEAGIRMPSQLGPIVSIVGALVIGEAAVRADFVSAPIIIVVAMTGIASYIIPRYSFAAPFRLLRFGLLLLAGLFGVYGLSVGLIAILIHLMTLDSFGVPYFSPVAPLIFRHLRDVLFRTPRWPARRRKA